MCSSYDYNVDVLQILVPCLTDDAKITICDYPNGFNNFYNIFIDVERKDGDPNKNIYNPIRLYWWEVPGRGEKWKQNIIEILGSEEEFNRCYDLCFKSTKKH